MLPKKPAAKKTAPVKTPTAKRPAGTRAKTPHKPAAKAPAKKVTPEIRAGLRLFQAPSDFKTACVEITFSTLQDGMVSPNGLTVERVKGSLDNPDAKRFDMFAYDPVTAAAIVARLSAVVHATNLFKRLPAKRRFMVSIRAGQSKDGMLTCGVKYVSIASKAGWVDLTKDETNPTLLNAFKKIRRAAVPLRGAFINCQLLPSGRQPKSQD